MAEDCADLNRDGIVNFADLAELRSQFGRDWEELPQCNKPHPVATMSVPNVYTDGRQITGPITVRIWEISPGCYRATVVDEQGTMSEPSEVYCLPTD